MKFHLLRRIFLFVIAFIIVPFYAKNLSQAPFNPDPQVKLPHSILKFLASKEIRFRHYMWHNCRNRWMSLTEKEKEDLKKMGWEPPRPSMDTNGNYLMFNDSGEDFLFMHRHMVLMVNERLAKHDFPYGKEVIGWKELPEPKDPFYPVPPPYGNNTFQQYIKSDTYFYNVMKPLSFKFRNSEYLKTVSLGQLGTELEFEIHNMMHIRWASNIRGIRPDISPFYETDKIEKKWDDVEYDWLEDFYASHVNPIFYKLHGWIDNRILDWQRANNVKVIDWKGNWTGPHQMDFMSHISSNNNVNNTSHEGKIEMKENNNTNITSINNSIDNHSINLNHNLHDTSNNTANSSNMNSINQTSKPQDTLINDTLMNKVGNNSESKENVLNISKDSVKISSNSTVDSNKTSKMKVFVNKTSNGVGKVETENKDNNGSKKSWISKLFGKLFNWTRFFSFSQQAFIEEETE